jgi:hypothetical protein
MRNRRRLSVIATIGFVLAVAVRPSAAQTSAPVVQHAAPDIAISEITLVKASDTTAVIRSKAGAVDTVKIADVVGDSKEITPGRLVLEEVFAGNDGKPNRALIVIKEGERGGTRYLQRADEPPLTGTKPLVVVPAAPDSAKPTLKKPPQM